MLKYANAMPNLSRTTSYLPKNLRAALEERGMTQQMLADLVGVSLRAVQKWVAGGSTPSATTLFRVADVLEKDPAWFFRANEPEEVAA
jgi:transcriptional regulator with XRE-family HTH domain